MKSRFCIILFFGAFQLVFSQLKTKYSIYLNFDSTSNQMTVSEKKMSDSIWVRTYKFSKDISQEVCKQALTVDENGALVKHKDHYNSQKKLGEITLYYYSYRNTFETLEKLPEQNTIDYNDFVNSDFKSFAKVLKNAENVYVIDNSLNKKPSGLIAYQVVF